MNTSINFVKRFTEKREIRGRVRAIRRVGVLSLSESDLAVASSFCFLEMMAGRLTQNFYRVEQNLGAIAMKTLNVILSNALTDPLGMEFLKL